jgi:hypothetical protein
MTKSEKGLTKKEDKPNLLQAGIGKKVDHSRPDRPHYRMELLNNFLNQLGRQDSIQQKSGNEDIDNIHLMDWSEYPEIELSPDLNKKITELQVIANSIENKNLDLSAITKAGQSDHIQPV